jgi:hypothetical protein
MAWPSRHLFYIPCRNLFYCVHFVLQFFFTFRCVTDLHCGYYWLWMQSKLSGLLAVWIIVLAVLPITSLLCVHFSPILAPKLLHHNLYSQPTQVPQPLYPWSFLSRVINGFRFISGNIAYGTSVDAV